MDFYPKAAMERAMKVQEVILRALAKKITWWQAAEIIGISDRSMRRWRERYQEFGYDGLMDRRRGKPSRRRIPVETVERVFALYREKYFDLNVQHFHEKLQPEHGIALSYTWVKQALQGAGLVARGRKRGVHRKRRARRPLPGMLLHIDGSRHRWFQDERWYDLIVILDDASSEIYYAQLVEEESTLTVMAGLKEVIERKGVFCALYSDRGSHFWLTPKVGGKVDYHRRTQVGRALHELGVQMIPAYSPEARGRSERNFGTWQGRLPQELRLHGIHSLEAANRFLREHYMAEFNRRFQVAPMQRGNAFVPRRSQDLERIFSLQFERAVQRDNTVSFQNLTLQIERVRWKATLAGCQVVVHQHLDGTLSLTYGPHCLGRYTPQGQALVSTHLPARRAVEKALAGKVIKPTFPSSLEIPQSTRDSHFPTAPTTTAAVFMKPDKSCATKSGHFNLLRTVGFLAALPRTMGPATNSK
ncbi:MAG TPA: ISNCY family transposase [Bryobacteraceae bacterium]|nr:ISNCY family transposase [Bryobacteraceae bacterium]